jgi:formiminoglutamase
MSRFLHVYPKADAAIGVNARGGEQKLGEMIQVASDGWQHSLHTSDATYVLLGIPEDIGVRANLGTGGAHTVWQSALKSFLNIQSTASLSGKEVLLLGHFDFSEWLEASLEMDTAALRELTAAVDEEVAPVIRAIVAAGKIPLVIGGGHNNCYPLLKGASEALGMPLNCINLDAHSDFRTMEGRHSGNGFRYARAGGYLHHYAMICLHENYNSSAVRSDLDADDRNQYSTFESIFIRGAHSFSHAIGEAIQHSAAAPLGIELDLDCIAGALSSAATPSGISTTDARRYMYQCGSLPGLAYLHIAEGAVLLRDGRRDDNTGKLIAYLLADFTRAGIAAQK